MIREQTIQTPNGFKDSYSFEEIINLRDAVYSGKKKYLDLSRIDFIEPYSMIGLLVLGREHLRNTGEKLGLVNIPFNIHQYLYRMDFFQKNIFTPVDNLDPKYFLKRSPLSRSVIEITDIPNKERESIRAITNIITLFRKRADYILKYWITSSVIDYFVTVISEICQNIFEHSLDSGYCAMQTYVSGGSHIFRLAIADSGIGIRESFTGKKEISYESTASLIEMALTTPLSSKREFGYGLCQVNTIIEKLGGTIYIRSGDASLTVMHNRRQGSAPYSFQKNGLSPFPGTQIAITLSS